MLSTLLSSIAYGSSDVYKDVSNKYFKKQLESQWGNKHQSLLTRITSIPHRLLIRPFVELGQGRIVQRTINTGKAIGYFVGSVADSERMARAGYLSSESLINPLGVVHEVISDAANLVSSPLKPMERLTSRISSCTNNIVYSTYLSKKLAMIPISPIVHVGNVVDGDYYETSDPGGGSVLNALNDGGIICTPATIKRNQSDSLAIERLQCAQNAFRTEYNFFGYNCGGYSRDVADVAGIRFTSLPNFGIGNELIDRENMKKIKAEAKTFCDNTISNFQLLLRDLELGADISIQRYMNVIGSIQSTDAAIQLAISTARNVVKTDDKQLLQILSASRLLKFRFQTKHYYSGDKKLGGMAQKLLTNMFFLTNQDEFEKIRMISERIAELFIDTFGGEPNQIKYLKKLVTTRRRHKSHFPKRSVKYVEVKR